MRSIGELEDKLTEPYEELIRDLAGVDGDILILGAGGKMGPSLAKLAVRAIREGGLNKRVIAVSRFSDSAVRGDLEQSGVEVISADILNEEELRSLPDAANVIYMVGYKFGTTGREHLAWAMNTYLPGRVAERYRHSRIVVFSSGNVYPFTSIHGGGADEGTPPEPVGEYAQSCLGRERIFTYHSHKNGTPMLIYRLNYAIDMRYGVLLDIAQAVYEGWPIDLTMGHANVIWQGDANAIALRCLTRCAAPPEILNVTGPETLSVRWAARKFGERFGREPVFEGAESETALLSNAAKCFQWFGYPRVSLLEMIDWVAEWVQAGGVTWNKPTHFQERKGKF